MKKLIVLIILFTLIFTLCACGPSKGQQTIKNFILIKSYDSGFFYNDSYYLYDINTNVVYLYTCAGSHATMCPYYVIVDGAPTIAIYGVNYFD